MMVLRLVLKGILKVYFRLVISSLIMMRSLEKFWKACNKMQIRIETLFVLYIQDTEYLVRCPFCHLCIGLLQKKNKQGDLRIYFLFENPLKFFTLSLEIPDKKKLSPWMFHRIVLGPLEMPMPKNKFLEFPHSIFLVTLWKFHFAFN